MSYSQLCGMRGQVITSGTSGANDANAWGQTFQYDVWGNLLGQTQTKGTIPSPSTPADSNNRVSGLNYDASGNVTSDGVNTYSWDAMGRVLSAANSTYVYDALGRRVRKNNNSAYTEFIFDGSSVIAERDQNGNWTDYIYGNGLIAKATGTTSAGTSYFHSDQIGSARVMTGAAAPTKAGYLISDGD